MIREFLHWGVAFLFKILSRLEVIGLENVPSSGAVLLAPNHLNILDPPLMFALLERKDITALAADKHKQNAIYRWLIESAGGIWINREEADFNALRLARAHLQAGGLLGIAPEGTRSRTGALIPAKTGIAYLADRAGVPVVPAALYGTEDALQQLLRFHRPAIHIQFGDPFRLPPIERKTREADLQRNTDEIMCRIAVMLPEKYRGVYAEHPRLKELLTNEAEEIKVSALARQTEAELELEIK
jgi:1-acyl-sn-glycerol-3-phosphate acyltransferase